MREQRRFDCEQRRRVDADDDERREATRLPGPGSGGGKKPSDERKGYLSRGKVKLLS